MIQTTKHGHKIFFDTNVKRKNGEIVYHDFDAGTVECHNQAFQIEFAIPTIQIVELVEILETIQRTEMKTIIQKLEIES